MKKSFYFALNYKKPNPCKTLKMMRILFITVFFTTIASAQIPCNFDTQVADTIGTYRSIKQQVVHELMFGKSERYLIFTLGNANDIPFLNLQLIEKSDSFLKTRCFDDKTKLYIQLENGKIIPMIFTGDDVCSQLLNIESGINTRVLEGNFLFVKGTMEELKQSKISLIRIKYVSESVDYPIRSSLDSELMKANYQPSTFFMDFLHCIE